MKKEWLEEMKSNMDDNDKEVEEMRLSYEEKLKAAQAACRPAAVALEWEGDTMAYGEMVACATKDLPSELIFSLQHAHSKSNMWSIGSPLWISSTCSTMWLGRFS